MTDEKKMLLEKADTLLNKAGIPIIEENQDIVEQMIRGIKELGVTC